MAIELNGTTGITTPGLTNTGTETIVNLTTTGNTILGDASTDTLNVGNGDLIKDSSGNVGIGVTPSAWRTTTKGFQIGSQGYISGNTANQAVNIGVNKYINSSNQELYITSDYASYYQQYQGSHTWLSAPSGTAGNAITFTQAMTLDASGNLLVGASAQFNDGKVCSQFNGDTTNGIALKTTRVAAGSTFAIFANSAGATAGSIYHNASTTVQYLTSSDYRLKENIAPMVGALDMVAKLKPVTYNWKEDGSDGQGFIAHELAEVVPDCVGGEKDAVDTEGKPQYQGIDTSFLVATLTAAIQELNAKFEEYKASHP